MLLAIFIHKSAFLMHLFLSAYGNTFYAICIRIADLHRGYGSRISAYGNVHLEYGPFHRPRPLPGLRYFSCLHVRPCLTNKWRKWREIKRKHRVF